MPLLLQHGPKATMDINGNFEKGYITRLSDGSYHFSVRYSPHLVNKLWGVALQDSVRTWDDTVIDKILLPGQNLVSSFLHPSTLPQLPWASFIYVLSLERDCPESLIVAMHP